MCIQFVVNGYLTNYVERTHQITFELIVSSIEDLCEDPNVVVMKAQTQNNIEQTYTYLISGALI